MVAMLDLVLSAGLPRLAGIDAAVPVSELKCFFRITSGEAAKGAAKRDGALLYFPSYEAEEGTLVELARAGGAVVFAFSDVLRERGFRRA
jgi:hypothetical protein